MMRVLLRTSLLALALIPSAADAAVQLTNFKTFIEGITRLLNLVIPITFGIALVAFFWGLVKFIYFSRENENTREEAKNIMVWGVLALFVMLSVWGFVRILQESIFGAAGTLP